MHGTRITREYMPLIAGDMGISVKELDEKMSKAYSEFRSKQDKEWTLNFFNKDEAWYEETLKKVQEIKSTLPKDIEPREEIKKMYGWIPYHKTLSIPLECDTEYAHALCIKLVLEDPSGYIRIISWD